MGTLLVADAAASPAPGPFVHLSVEQGLSQSSVQAIVQDHRGFMWFGTEEGLNRYDGYRFVVFRHNPARSSSLPDDSISALFEDRHQRLWVGTQHGLCFYDEATGDFTPVAQVRDRITGIVESADGTLWMASQGGGLYLRPAGAEAFVSYLPDARYPWDSLSSYSLSAVYLDRQGRIWLASRDHGVDRFVPGKPFGKFIHYRHDAADPASLSSDNAWSIAENSQGELMVATYGGGLNILDEASGRFRQIRANGTSGLSTDLLTATYRDHSGNVWLGTDGAGLMEYDSRTETVGPVASVGPERAMLAQAVVRSIFEDNQGHLWIGTYQSGIGQLAVARHDFGYFTHEATDPQSLSDGSVASVLEDRAGQIWVGTERGVLNQFNPATGTSVRYPFPAPASGAPALMSLHEDGSGRLWVGTFGRGLARFDPQSGKFERVPPGAGLANQEIWAMAAGSAGTLWLGTNDGVDQYDPSTSRVVRHLGAELGNNLGGLSVRSLYVDERGTLWIGSFAGLAALPAGASAVTHYLHDPANPASLSNDVVVAIRSDGHGQIWAGTLGGGLDRLDTATGRFVRFDGFPSHSIDAIETDSQGHLWLSSNHGLVRLDSAGAGWASFDLSNGLQSLQFHLGASARLRDGRLMFGSADGLYLFDPAQIHPNESAPPLVISGVRVLNRPVQFPPAGVELKAADKMISLEFAALDYNFPRRNNYAYTLEGLTHDWIDLQEQREVSFTNLAPGHYRFRVRASNSDGLWREGSSASLALTVRPPLWATWWFRAAMAAAVAALLLLAHRLRISSLHHALAVRKESERVLRQAEEKYRELVEAIGDVIFSTDEAGCVTYISPVVETLLGFRPEDLTGNPLSRLVGEAGWQAIQSSFRGRGPGPGSPIEWDIRSRAGEIHSVRISLRPIEEEGETVGIRGVLTDVTELKRMETHLRQSQKMDAIGQLAGGIAHDFNNLLTAIMGFADLLKGHKLAGGAREAAVDEILAASERAANLTHQLLAFSRQQALTPQVLNLNALLAEIEKMLQRLIGANIMLVLSLDPKLGMVRADAGQIQQIILNLVVNARDAMPDGGRVLIRTSNDTNSQTGESSVVLSVTDNGIGMPPEVRARLFEPFFTTKDVGKGTGLGLSTVYGIVRQSDGRIEVESAPGLGSTFTVMLPRCDAPRLAAAAALPPPVLPAGIGTVLVVDDNERVARIATEILQNAGAAVLFARNAAEALDLCENRQIQIGLLVTDVVMPGRNGLQLADELQIRYPAMKVLFMSGYADDVIGAGAGDLSGRSFLQKPFKEDVLLRKVAAIVAD